jgi:hypothetical protein
MTLPSPLTTASDARDLRARARDIRATLPGQLRQQRLTAAALLYGPLSSLDELHTRIGRMLPWRFGAVRRAKVVAIEESDCALSDELLLSYDDAARLGVFSRFMIARPAYYWCARGRPWLIAEVEGTERWAVIAQESADGR